MLNDEFGLLGLDLHDENVGEIVNNNDDEDEIPTISIPLTPDNENEDLMPNLLSEDDAGLLCPTTTSGIEGKEQEQQEQQPATKAMESKDEVDDEDWWGEARRGSSSRANYSSSSSSRVSSRVQQEEVVPNLVPTFDENSSTTSSGNIHRPFVPHAGSLRRIRMSSSVRSSSSSSSSRVGDVEVYSVPIVARCENPDDCRGSSVSSRSMGRCMDDVGGGGFGDLRGNEDDGAVVTLTVVAHDLQFDRSEYETAMRLFSILDTESRGSVERNAVKEFLELRCPVFRRRDRALGKLDRGCRSKGCSSSATFDEIWDAVISCTASPAPTPSSPSSPYTTKVLVELGIEGWMVFCRFVSLAQYQEAKRRFSSRHLQQTMRHRNGGRGSEVVLVNVPPPDPPEVLSPWVLVQYETSEVEDEDDFGEISGKRRRRKKKGGLGKHLSKPPPLGMPELDLDHCMVSAHDATHSSDWRHSRLRKQGAPSSRRVEVSLFGSSTPSVLSQHAYASSSSTPLTPDLEFILRYASQWNPTEASDTSSSVVRRTFSDIEWLRNTFESHKKPGGTLCGRILPPFPLKPSQSYSSTHTSRHSTDIVFANTSLEDEDSQGVISKVAAVTGVGKIASVAKSFLGALSSSPPVSDGILRKNVRKKAVMINVPLEGYGGKMEASSNARSLERYLNYLLEHPSLSSSFPLNVILKASQSGIESAKRILEDQTRIRERQREATTNKNISRSDYEVPLVRTAAQAAMALKIHGILENYARCPSASAKIQHASLPGFEMGVSRQPSWGDEDGVAVGSGELEKGVGEEEDNFEAGVVNVKSELDTEVDCLDDAGGFDLLPSPVMGREQSVLCAGSDVEGGGAEVPGYPQSSSHARVNPPKFYYGNRPSHASDSPGQEGSSDKAAVLGDMAVDEDIEKLRDVIASVDNTLGRCLSASVGIGDARRTRDALHLGIVKGLDSWEGMRGEFIAQRALLAGVTTLEGGSGVADAGLLSLIDDLSWQASLASSAVSAANEVQVAVQTARIASGAKVAADTAFTTAQNALAKANPEESKNLQNRASNARSHAIHAAVVEHEAAMAKRRAAVALAHDVRCWNVHRKREILRTCREAAERQRDACRQASLGWNQLLDGLVSSSTVPLMEQDEMAPFQKEEEEEEEESREGAVASSTFVLPYLSPNYFGGEQAESKAIIPSDLEGYDDLAADRSHPPPEPAGLKDNPLEKETVSPIDLSGGQLIEDVSSFEDSKCVPSSTESNCASEAITREAHAEPEQHPSHLGCESEKDDGVLGSSPAVGRGVLDGLLQFTEAEDEEEEENIRPAETLGEEQRGGGLLDNLFAEADDAGSQNMGHDIFSAPNEKEPEPTKAVFPSESDQNFEHRKEHMLNTPFPAPIDMAEQRKEEKCSQHESSHAGLDQNDGVILEASLKSPPTPELLPATADSEDLPPFAPHKGHDVPIKEGLGSKKWATDKADDGDGEEKNPMTESMQSLVDGLMAWGGQYDDDELSIPNDMAVSIALEESGLLE